MKQINTFKNLLQLQRYFTTEKVCIEYLENQRWNGNITCPHCNTANPYKTVTRSKKPELQGTFDYRCRNKACFKKFNAQTKTIFENTKIELKTWFAAMYLVTSNKKGCSSLNLHRLLGVTQTTSWFLLSRIREMLKDNNFEREEGTFEVDETYIGGKRSNKHAKQRKALEEKYGPGYGEKIPVVGVLQRNGKVAAFRIEKAVGTMLKPVIYSRVAKGSTVMTDGHGGYTGLSKDYNHVVINHEQGQYVTEGNFHTNTLEGFWGIFKRGIYGIYHSVSAKHLDRYCGEFTFRYNTRELEDADRFANAISQVTNARITYKQLTAKKPN